MKFIKLTKDGNPIWINTQNIIAFHPTPDNKTILMLSAEGTKWFIVSETTEEILRQIQFAKTV